MSKLLKASFSILDTDTRAKLPFILLSFGAIALLDAVGISLIFPFMISLADPKSLADFPLFQQFFGDFDEKQFALILAAIVSILFVLKNIATVLILKWQFKTLFHAERILGVQLLASYLNTPWTKISGRNSSELIRNASVSTSHVFLSFFIPIITIFVELLLTTAVLTILLFVDAVSAALSLALIVLSAAIYYFLVRKRLPHIGEQFQRASYDVLNDLKVAIGASREIRVLERRDEFVSGLDQSREQYAQSQAARSFLTQVPRYYLEVVLIAVVISIIAFSANTRPMAEIAPLLAVFAVAFLRLMNSATRILASYQQVRIGVPALQNILEEFDRVEGDAQSPPQVSNMPAVANKHGLLLQDVTFSYFQGPKVLDEVNLAIGWGDCIGIIGPSGGGKSTLFDSMLGLIRPDKGAVLADGADIQDDLPGWHARIGYVPQAVYLSDDTLRKNVAFGTPESEIDDHRVLQALELAQLADFTASLEHGIETQIGEQGSRLSGGQRQRIGIARALYNDPQILFLDEATSALDDATENQFVEAIDGLKSGKTIIIIAHRISTLRICDKIYAMKGGNLEEVPTEKAELLVSEINKPDGIK